MSSKVLVMTRTNNSNSNISNSSGNSNSTNNNSMVNNKCTVMVISSNSMVVAINNKWVIILVCKCSRNNKWLLQFNKQFLCKLLQADLNQRLQQNLFLVERLLTQKSNSQIQMMTMMHQRRKRVERKVKRRALFNQQWFQKKKRLI